ncbi:MAG: thiamine biosynthesis protein ThiS [Bryobacterales bacterium]|nr:thiamine biosynthesis protein ThiS [Bryobacterales bacterium]
MELGQGISILVNGVKREVPGGQSVSDLLRRLEISSERVAVELDKSIVRKRDWERTVVADGAEIEVVEFVGGG